MDDLDVREIGEAHDLDEELESAGDHGLGGDNGRQDGSDHAGGVGRLLRPRERM